MNDKEFEKLLEQVVKEDITPRDLIVEKVKDKKNPKNLLTLSFSLFLVFTIVLNFGIGYLTLNNGNIFKGMLIWSFSMSFIFNIIMILVLSYKNKVTEFFIEFENKLTTK